MRQVVSVLQLRAGDRVRDRDRCGIVQRDMKPGDRFTSVLWDDGADSVIALWALEVMEIVSPCRRCSECEGENHHWIAHCDDPGEVGDAFVGFICKHCDARAEMCDSCDGTNEPGHQCEAFDCEMLEGSLDNSPRVAVSPATAIQGVTAQRLRRIADDIDRGRYEEAHIHRATLTTVGASAPLGDLYTISLKHKSDESPDAGHTGGAK